MQAAHSQHWPYFDTAALTACQEHHTRSCSTCGSALFCCAPALSGLSRSLLDHTRACPDSSTISDHLQAYLRHVCSLSPAHSMREGTEYPPAGCSCAACRPCPCPAHTSARPGPRSSPPGSWWWRPSPAWLSCAERSHTRPRCPGPPSPAPHGFTFIHLSFFCNCHFNGRSWPAKSAWKWEAPGNYFLSDMPLVRVPLPHQPHQLQPNSSDLKQAHVADAVSCREPDLV